MTTPQTILLLGATGRTGQRVLRQLLARGLRVRAIVRSAGRLPPDLAGHPGLTLVEASPLELPDDDLRRLLRDSHAVVSCLGHVISLAGVFGPPRDLVTRATMRVCRGIQANAPAAPVRLVLMTSVSVHRAGAVDARRGAVERALLWALRGLVPPARDNQRAADFLAEEIGPADASLEWVVVRPDTLLEGEVSPYALHEGLVNGIFSPGQTTMANVAHFMCELVTDPTTWARWRSTLPVIVDGAPLATSGGAPGSRASPNSRAEVC